MFGIQQKSSPNEQKSSPNEQKSSSNCKSCCSKENKKSEKFPKDAFYLNEDMDLSEILNEAPTILKFTADWCKPCKAIEPTYNKCSQSSEYSHVHFVSINVDEHDDIMAKYGVTAIPAFITFRGNEKEYSRINKVDEEKLVEFIKAAFN